jgi:CheY-like chemotaxis protein
VLPRLFVAFEQGDPSITRRFGGLGLGLSIASALVAAHGGRLTVASAGRSRGATFTVEMPTLRDGEAPPAAPVHAPAHHVAPNDKRARILLVDDHIDTLRAIRALLGRSGHTIVTANSVETASHIVSSSDGHPIDLLICDIGLPDGSGIDVLRELRARQPDVHAIALSGYGMDDDVRRSIDAGFARHLTKPVDSEMLEGAIEELIAGRVSE